MFYYHLPSVRYIYTSFNFDFLPLYSVQVIRNVPLLQMFTANLTKISKATLRDEVHKQIPRFEDNYFRGTWCCYEGKGFEIVGLFGTKHYVEVFAFNKSVGLFLPCSLLGYEQNHKRVHGAGKVWSGWDGM